MSTRSGTEFRAGGSASPLPEDIPDWARTILRGQEETKTQIEFLMTQLLELKTNKSTEIPPLATAFGVDSPTASALEEAKMEPQMQRCSKERSQAGGNDLRRLTRPQEIYGLGGGAR